MMKKIFGTVALATGLLGAAACSAPSEAETPRPAPETPSPESTPQEPVATPQEPSEEPVEDVPIEAFNGASAEVYPFDVYVNEAYVDEDGYITDGMGFSDQAPEGMEYHIFNIQVTNNADFPGPFSTEGTLGRDSEGRTHVNDTGAEFVIADDYLWEDLNPGTSVETDIVFLLPEGTSLVEVDVPGYDTLVPFDE